MGKLNRLVGAACLAMLFATGGPAHAQEATGPYRAGDVVDACKIALTQGANEDRMVALVEGMCLGAISTVMRFGPQMNEQFRFCPPAAATPQQVIPIVVKFIDGNPKALNLDIRDVANYVGRLTWPCR